MDGGLRHFNHLRKTGLNEVGLSLPFRIVVRTFSPQPPDDAIQ
jgi:hypothetical protein